MRLSVALLAHHHHLSIAGGILGGHLVLLIVVVVIVGLVLKLRKKASYSLDTDSIYE